MPRDYSRTEVHFSREITHKLNLFSQELKEKTGRRVTRSAVVIEIVELFFRTSQNTK